ncbi:hypothetical protein AVEN_92558-1 [Araneus ventricosus]|uniref:Uncharacterized protein n=1 Tax=Araneus ventricosus TaxID=182803 RepID=A0A4Y2AK78_ARAVE|nr:hypothetical protein AVEN_92558-1 [Araneus ventricosus]
MNDPVGTTLNWALWPPHYSPHYEQLMRQPLRQRYDPSSIGITRSTPLLYPTGKRDSAYLYGKFASPYLRCSLKWEESCNMKYLMLRSMS